VDRRLRRQAAGIAALKSDRPEQRIAGTLLSVQQNKGLFAKLFKKDPIDRVSDRLKTTRKRLEAAPPDFPKALQELTNANNEIAAEQAPDERSKAALLTAVTTIRDACEKKDVPQTQQLIADWFAGLEK